MDRMKLVLAKMVVSLKTVLTTKSTLLKYKENLGKVGVVKGVDE